MNRLLKVLSALLSYPQPEMIAALPEMRTAIAGAAGLGKKTQRRLNGFIDHLTGLPLLDLQEAYVLLFDRSRSLSLHLFEHIHGEGRDRGQAMVDLAAIYARHGLAVAGGELPDFLPLYLEFLSTREADEARRQHRDPLSVIQALAERLEARKSPYSVVLGALVELAGSAPKAAELAALRRVPPDDPNDFEAIDKAWEETMVQFGPGAPEAEASCPLAGQAVARMRRPDPAPEEASNG